MQVVILEVVVMSDVVDDSTFQQAGAVEQRLPLVTGQSNSLQPQHHFTAKECVHHTVLPTPAQQHKYTHKHVLFQNTQFNADLKLKMRKHEKRLAP